jgi:hypothetical protein
VKWFEGSSRDSSFEDGGVYCRAGEPMTDGITERALSVA